MPMHGVHSSVILPSGVVSPMAMPSSSQKAGPPLDAVHLSITSSQRRMMIWPPHESAAVVAVTFTDLPDG
jgi:hypothetical protein